MPFLQLYIIGTQTQYLAIVEINMLIRESRLFYLNATIAYRGSWIYEMEVMLL